MWLYGVERVSMEEGVDGIREKGGNGGNGKEGEVGISDG
jgi:hypothetical protein